MMETAVLDLSTTQKDFITSEMDELETTFCPSCASELITESEVSNGRCSHCSETGEGSSSNAENTSPVDLSIRSSSSSASTTTAKVTSTTTITCDAGQITTPNGSNSGLELPENLLPSLADVAASSSIAYNVLVQRLLLASAVAAQVDSVNCATNKQTNNGDSEEESRSMNSQMKSRTAEEPFLSSTSAVSKT
ncbi:uncharacterized protein LOC134841964 isoform X2 [Symsagittifera roscoffensis]|uniref:uncharacterized protein LOC134841964 isoform X2 n=1 Tax=Symsagittifera roscoffensis TaxID=84072 RepID=UPI00307B5C29